MVGEPCILEFVLFVVEHNRLQIREWEVIKVEKIVQLDDRIMNHLALNSSENKNAYNYSYSLIQLNKNVLYLCINSYIPCSFCKSKLIGLIFLIEQRSYRIIYIATCIFIIFECVKKYFKMQK